MALYSYDYNRNYSLSAPIVAIDVYGTNANSQKITALIDSGADATMLPFSLLEQLGADEVETRYLRTITGRRSIVDLYRVSIHIGPFQIPAIRAIATDSSMEAIIGRDVLNQLIVTLNGLAGVTEISN